MISEAVPVQCRLGPAACYPRSVINAMTLLNVQKQTTRLRDVAWSQKPHACRHEVPSPKPALMQADQRERALIVGDREKFFFCSAVLLAGGFSQALLNARGPSQSLPKGPSKAAKDSPVRPLLCSAVQLQRPSALRLRCGPAEFRGAAAEGWIRRVKGLRRWCVVIGPRAACAPA